MNVIPIVTGIVCGVAMGLIFGTSIVVDVTINLVDEGNEENKTNEDKETTS